MAPEVCGAAAGAGIQAFLHRLSRVPRPERALQHLAYDLAGIGGAQALAAHLSAPGCRVVRGERVCGPCTLHTLAEPLAYACIVLLTDQVRHLAAGTAADVAVAALRHPSRRLQLPSRLLASQVLAMVQPDNAKLYTVLAMQCDCAGAATDAVGAIFGLCPRATAHGMRRLRHTVAAPPGTAPQQQTQQQQEEEEEEEKENVGEEGEEERERSAKRRRTQPPGSAAAAGVPVVPEAGRQAQSELSALVASWQDAPGGGQAVPASLQAHLRQLCDSPDIEAGFGLLDIANSVTDDGIFVQLLAVFASPGMSRRASSTVLRLVVLPRCEQLSAPASRILFAGVSSLVTAYPKAAVSDVLLPLCLSATAASPSIELVSRLVKEVVPPAAAVDLLSLLATTTGTVWTDCHVSVATVILAQPVAEHVTDAVLVAVLRKVSMQVDQLAKAQKLAKLLLTLVSRHAALVAGQAPLVATILAQIKQPAMMVKRINTLLSAAVSKHAGAS